MNPTEVSYRTTDFKMTTPFGWMLIYLAFIAGLATANAQTDITDEWHKLNSSSKSVQLMTDPKSWKGAKKYCNERNANLLEIENVQIQEEVSHYLEGQKSSVTGPHLYWIGIRMKGDTYTWASSDKEGSYNNWRLNHPINTTVYCGQIDGMQTTLYKWQTEWCGQERKFICEKDQGSTTDQGEETSRNTVMSVRTTTSTSIKPSEKYKPQKPIQKNITIWQDGLTIEVDIIFYSNPLVSETYLLVNGSKVEWKLVIHRDKMKENELLHKGQEGVDQKSLNNLTRIRLFLDQEKLKERNINVLTVRAANTEGSTDYVIDLGDVTSSTSSSDDNNIIYIIVAVIAVVVALLLVITVAVFIFKRSKRSTTTPTKSSENEKKQTKLNPEKDDGRFVSDDGLVYVTVEHAQGSKKESEVKPDVTATVKSEPRFERVEYVALDFQKSGKMEVSE